MRRITKSIVFKNLYQISKDKYEKFPVESYEVGQRLDRYLKSTPIGWVNCQKCLRKK